MLAAATPHGRSIRETSRLVYVISLVSGVRAPASRLTCGRRMIGEPLSTLFQEENRSRVAPPCRNVRHFDAVPFEMYISFSHAIRVAGGIQEG